MNTPTTVHIIRKPEVLQQFGFSRSTLYLRINNGLIPPPISLGGRAVGWLSNEIDSTLNAMVAGKTETEIKALIVELVELRKQAA